MQLEKFGLRKASYPFDWIISDFEGVVRAIDSGFENFIISREFENYVLCLSMVS